MFYLLAFMAGGCFGAYVGALMAAAPTSTVYHPDAYEGQSRAS